MHLACRSCHANDDPDALRKTDCGVCHTPRHETPSLFPLLPSAAITLTVTFDETVPTDRREGFDKSLRAALHDSAVHLIEDDLEPAAPAVVSLRIESGTGRTDTGTEFWVARAIADVTVHRARVVVSGRVGVDSDRAEAVRKALEGVLTPIEASLAW